MKRRQSVRDSAPPFHTEGLARARPPSDEPPRLELLPVRSLKPYSRNARVHSHKQVRQIAESMRRFGVTVPLLIEEHNTVLAGYGRLLAAKSINLEILPCRRIEGLSDTEKRAYVLADNKLSLNGTWDEEILGVELQGLLADQFDISLTGFSLPEVDTLVENLVPEEPGAPEDDVLPAQAPQRCRPGNIWQLGPSRLICGDARDPAVVKALMSGARAQMGFTDPPWNIRISGNVSGKGAVKHREFAMASGEMTSQQFEQFLKTAFTRMIEVSTDGSIHFICMDWRHIREIVSAGDEVFGELKNLIVWAKDNGGMGTFYRSRHELIFAYRHGSASNINNFGLGGEGRYRTNVWSYKGANSFHRDRMSELALHPTVKPVQMIADAIKDVSQRGAIVLDLFGGSGSTLIAAHKSGRLAYLCEIDPLYCDRIIARWEAYAKDDAKLISRHTAASSKKERSRR